MVIQKELLQNLPTNALFTQVSPDQPYFIKSDNISFQQAYDNFLQHKIFTQQFLVPPNPQSTQDILMPQKKYQYFFEYVVENSQDYFTLQNNAIQELCLTKNESLPNNFLHPLYFAYKNKELNIPVYIGGYPRLLLVDILSQTFQEETLKNLKKEHFDKKNYEQQIKKFQIENFKNLFAIEIEYIKRNLQNICLSNEKVIAFVDYVYQSLKQDEQKNEYRQIDDLVNINDNILVEIDFKNYIDKMVLLDYILADSFILKLIKQGIFPFKLHKNINDHIFGLNYCNSYYKAQASLLQKNFVNIESLQLKNKTDRLMKNIEQQDEIVKHYKKNKLKNHQNQIKE